MATYAMTRNIIYRRNLSVDLIPDQVDDNFFGIDTDLATLTNQVNAQAVTLSMSALLTGASFSGPVSATGFTGSGSGLTDIPNGALTNPGFTLGSTQVALGDSVNTISGLSAITAVTLNGNLNGTASNASQLNGLPPSFYVNTSNFTEGSNLFFTNGRALAATLDQFSATVGGHVISTDTVLLALGRLENRTSINDAKVTYPGPPAFSQVTNKPTTLSGYGITDAVKASQSIYLGTSQVALNRNSGSLSLSGVSIDGNASTVTTNANLTGDVTSVGNLTSLSPAVVMTKTLSGYSIGANTPLSTTDTLAQALGKVQGQLNANAAATAIAGQLQTITLTGDASGNGSQNIAVTLADTGVTPGTYNSDPAKQTPFTVDSKGRITSIGSPAAIVLNWSNIVSRPTTLSGYGITDAVPSSLVGVASGLATLDASGKVTVAQLPSSISGALCYYGTYDAAHNNPVIPAAQTSNVGGYYVVNVPGLTSSVGVTDPNPYTISAAYRPTGSSTASDYPDAVTWTNLANAYDTSETSLDTTTYSEISQQGGDNSSVVYTFSGDTRVTGTLLVSLAISAAAQNTGNGFFSKNNVLYSTDGGVNWYTLYTLEALDPTDNTTSFTGVVSAPITSITLNSLQVKIAVDCYGGATSDIKIYDIALLQPSTTLKTTNSVNPASTQFNVGDWIVSNGVTWDKVEGASSDVVTVCGRPPVNGDVALAVSDISGAAPVNSPTLTGVPIAPTPSANDSSSKIATTAFYFGQAGKATPLMNGAAVPGSGALWAHEDHVHPIDTSRAPLASPSLQGNPTAPTPVTTDNSTSIATTAYVKNQGYLTSVPVTSVAGKIGSVTLGVSDITGAAPSDTPVFTGNPTAPTPITSDDSASLATTAYVKAQGYLTSVPVTSVFGRTGAITLSMTDVTTALGFTPYDSANPSGFISGITSPMVVASLGFTPYDASNPSNYISGVTSSMIVSALGYTPYNATTNSSGYISGITSAIVKSALGYTPYNASNPSNYITGITSTMVTTALGFTPYNASNPSGYISSINSTMISNALGYTPSAVTISLSNLNNNDYQVLCGSTNTAAYGSTKVTMNPSTGAINCGPITSTGDVTAFSDARLKENIESIDDPLSILKAFRGVYHNWTASAQGMGLPEGKQIGVIAQELQGVLPEVVRTASLQGADFLAVSYSKIIPVLVEAIKKQQSEIDYLKSLWR